MSLENYRPLGKSGLIVSPLALGTMTFGTARWGSPEDLSREIFNIYVDHGGNFIDTADVYSAGRSEEMVGSFVADRKMRDQIVIATKAGFGTGKLQGGNGAKHIHASLEASLKRLQTDYVDLFWVHIWDGITPAYELLQTMANLVATGKIRYWGLSNSPAWYVAQIATLARERGMPSPIAIQYFYSLVNREIEDEHLPLTQEFGMAIVPWSPLAYGFLTGKYDRKTVEASAPRASDLPRDAAGAHESRASDDKRLDGANPFGDTLFTPHNWTIVGLLKQIAGEIGCTPAQLALAWVTQSKGVASTLMGVSRPNQILDNAGALNLQIPQNHRDALDAISAPVAPRMLYNLFTDQMRQNAVFGGAAVQRYS